MAASIARCAATRTARPAAGGRRCSVPALPVPRAPRRAGLTVRAATQGDKPAIAQYADSIGLPTDEGLFGFRPFAETWCGRLAMMGFVTSIVEEAITGQGTLVQVGLTPSGGLLTGLCALFGGMTLLGTADTVRRLVSRKMSAGDVARYKNFLGLNNPNDFMAAAAQMKAKGDFTSLSQDSANIAAVRSAGMPADRVLGLGAKGEADTAAREMKATDGGVLTLTKEDEAAQVAAAEAEIKAREAAPAPGATVSLSARRDIQEQGAFSASAEMAYARNVELSNGRWAMVGFLTAVLVEAGTGKGIILQVIMWLKLSGLLGAASGF